MRVIAIPVKSLDRSKSRLAGVLAPLERAALTLAMLEDVLDACRDNPGWETWVVSPDETVLEVAASRKVRSIVEESGPLARSIAQVERLAKERGADALAILPGDLPTLTGDALGRALRTLGSVVLAPSRDGLGTSLLLRRPPRCIAARFGPDSLARHRAQAEERGLPVAIVHESTLAFDVDVPQDLRTLLSVPDAGRARRALIDMEVGARLADLD